ncbi:hypothetical protein AB0K02_11230 [Streptomyces sp. NPDC049597]|uniref:hypothetical protein n=1 Tax=Streptomyces sp. NPDC049597 TaxID=3155276 RepID=UPI00342420CB
MRSDGRCWSLAIAATDSFAMAAKVREAISLRALRVSGATYALVQGVRRRLDAGVQRRRAERADDGGVEHAGGLDVV